MKYFIGVDPGWTNLGYSIISEDLGTILTGHLVPRDLPPGSTPDILLQRLSGALEGFHPARDILFGAMERFVYYKGVHNPNSEQILMVTGQLQYFYHLTHTPVKLFRAVEWKNFLVRYLFKTMGFRNENADGSLDKNFSFAAARAIADHFGREDYEFKTDHEADAFCLSYLSRLSYYQNRK